MTDNGEPIFVTKSFLPPVEEYESLLDEIWRSRQLTNQGPLLRRFETEVERYLDLTGFHFVSNGTVAIQIALRALDVTDGEVITTPFSYVATTSAILWERCTPVFVDIDPETLCLDPDQLEAAITPATRAILPVHVFGQACDVNRIGAIAARHGLPVVYDGAHAFGASHEGRALLARGDISTCSFHATKPMHTVEGGGVVATDTAVSERVELIKRFGHNHDDHVQLGINGKASEFHAAMGLCSLRWFDKLAAARRELTQLYDELLEPVPEVARKQLGTRGENAAYYPVVLPSEAHVHEALAQLSRENIHPRRYFYPALNTLPYLERRTSCPVAERIAASILCLPLFAELDHRVVHRVCDILRTVAATPAKQ